MVAVVRSLSKSPNLSVMYAKAAVTAVARRGVADAVLPTTECSRTGVVAEPEAVARYGRVCGFRLTGELPPTYPHILCFPLAVRLMTDRWFPFPLPGLVHVGNRITIARPLRIDEPLTVTVRAEALRPHDRGVQFDVVSTISVEGVPLWTEVSTYLRRRGTGGPDGRAPATDVEHAPCARWVIPGDIGRLYAAVSGDRNPIHLYPLTARLFGFRRAIAHGMWTKARCLAGLEGRLPPAYTVDVAFAAPVLLPAKVGFAVWETRDGTAFGLWRESDGRPHVVGTIRSRS